MAISWLKTWTRWFAGVTEPVKEQLVSTTENARFDVVEANEKLGEFRKKLAKLMAQNDPSTGSLTKQIKTLTANIAKYGRLAATAVEAGKDDGARAALTKKSQLTTQLSGLQKVWDDNEKVIATMRDDIKQRQGLVDSAQGKIAVFEVRSASQEIRRSLVEAKTGLGANDAFGRLASLEDHYDNEDSELNALETLAGDVNDDELLANIEVNSEVDDELARLKVSLGK